MKSKLETYMEKNNLSAKDVAARTGYALSIVYRNMKFGVISNKTAERYAEAFFEPVKTFKDSKAVADGLLEVQECLSD